MPEISVIIPLYNKVKYIRRTIDSVLGQSFSDFELIIVDDGSTDGSLELIRDEYSDERIRLVSQTNAGPGAARNHGIRLAASEYIAFIDGDDEWHSDYLASQYKCLSENTECALSICRLGHNSADNLWKLDHLLLENAGVWRLGPDDDYDMMRHMLAAMSPGNTLWRKDTLERYNGFYEKKALIGEDQYLVIQTILNHAVYINDKVNHIYHYEASDLVANRKEFRPLVLDPEPVRAQCPEEMRACFEYFLTELAFGECCGLVWPRTIDTVLKLRKMYPDMDKVCGKKYPKKYLKLKVKVLVYPVLKLFWKRNTIIEPQR